MTIKAAIPYLFFDGDAEDALKLYERALGARVEGLMHYDQMPKEAGPPGVDPKRVMHALVHIGQARFMASDVPTAGARSASSNVEITLEFDDVAEMTRAFERLAEGGSVTMAIHDAFWGDKFGAVVDPYGIHWMLTSPVQGS